jgi:hypothetical protein
VEPQALDVELPATTDASTPTLESPEATVRKKKDSAVPWVATRDSDFIVIQWD